MFKNLLIAMDLSPASICLLGCMGPLRGAGAESATLLHVEFGRPGTLIVEKIRTGGYSMLVIAGQGRGYMAEAFLGRVANHVVHRSTIPVLVVPGGR
jgi:nucleotide-binding universal stress UspA family protein